MRKFQGFGGKGNKHGKTLKFKNYHYFVIITDIFLGHKFLMTFGLSGTPYYAVM